MGQTVLGGGAKKKSKKKLKELSGSKGKLDGLLTFAYMQISLKVDHLKQSSLIRQ